MCEEREGEGQKRKAGSYPYLDYLVCVCLFIFCVCAKKIGSKKISTHNTKKSEQFKRLPLEPSFFPPFPIFPAVFGDILSVPEILEFSFYFMGCLGGTTLTPTFHILSHTFIPFHPILSK